MEKVNAFMSVILKFIIIVILLIGIAGAIYLYLIKPVLDEKEAEEALYQERVEIVTENKEYFESSEANPEENYEFYRGYYCGKGDASGIISAEHYEQLLEQYKKNKERAENEYEAIMNGEDKNVKPHEQW